ncbi:DinB family protein [Bacillus marinisedimentorum]|uniref:DinB family protein n=1 Tax=Bacillus marinisedimentorum TaxID=1821260 RepID=UPI00087226C0|nr:DinB family protein [Bacillus marinisedimentorum]
MTEKEILKQVRFVRDLTLNAVEKLDEQTIDEKPPGFRNTIRWNIGHIITSQELLLGKFTGISAMSLPDSYIELFSPGTKPADWKQEAPSLDELNRMLKEQPQRIEDALSGKLDDPVAKPFKIGAQGELSRIGEILNFTIYHEGLHQGHISALQRAIAGKETR